MPKPCVTLPVARLTVPATGLVGQPITIDGRASTPGRGQIQSWQIFFGDGQTQTGTGNASTILVTHTYSAAGTYLVLLVVTDNFAASLPARATIGISPTPPTPPPAPTITCPGPITVQAPAASTRVAVTYPPIAVVGGALPVVLTLAPPSGSLFDVGTTSVTALATDALARTASCLFAVVVLEPEPPPPPPPQPPAAPTGLTATALATTRIDLAWTDVATTETGYRIERCTGASCTGFTQIALALANATTFSDTTVAQNTLYRYRVLAVNTAGASAASNIAEATTPQDPPPPPPPDTTAPTVPTALAASLITQTTLTLSWTPATDAVGVTGYRIYRDGSAVHDNVGAPPAAAFAVTGLTCGTAYSFQVDAVDGAGNRSALSLPLTVSTTACDPPPPPPPVPPVLTSFTLLPTSVVGGTPVVGTVTLDVVAPTGGTLITFASSNTAAVPVPASITVPAGALSAQVPIATQVVSGPTAALLTASTTSVPSSSRNATLQVTPVPPTLVSATVSPAAVNAGVNATLTVTLSGPALTGGALVTLTSSAPAVAVLPTSVTIPAGASSTTAPVTTVSTAPTTTVTLSAAHASVTRTATLTVTAIPQPDTTPPTVPTGLAVGTITQTSIALQWNAATDNVGVTGYGVYQDSLRIATVSAPTLTYLVTPLTCGTPYTFRVDAVDAAGNRSAVSAPVVGTTAACPPPPPPPVAKVTAFTVSPTSVLGGNPTTGTVTLDIPAPTGGAVVTFTSATPSAVPTPANLTIPSGQASATLPIPTQAVTLATTVTLTAAAGGQSRSTTLTVTAPVPTLVSLTVSPGSVEAGQGATATVTLSSPAPPGGTVVALSSSVPATAQIQPSVAVPTSLTTAAVPITTTVGTSGSVTFTATLAAITRTAGLLVTAPPPPPPPPSAPTGLTATATAAPSVLLGWTDTASNESGFTIERCTGAACTTFAQIGTVGPNVVTFTDASVAPSTTYRYRVQAWNAVGASAYSNIASATTPAAPPPSSTHPRLLMTLAGASPTVAELQTRYGTGGPQAAHFQAFVDVYCRTSANGGVLDSPRPPHLACFIYGWLIATYPVPGITYRDAGTLGGLTTPFLAAVDAVIPAETNSHTFYALACAYDWGYNVLSAARRSAIITALQAFAAPNGGNVNPFAHADTGGRGRTCSVLAGYVYTGDNPASDADALARIATAATYITGAAGNRTCRTFQAGTAGGYPEGMGYYMSETLQSYGFGELVASEMIRTATGSAAMWAAGASTDLEYWPQYMAYLLYPYRPQVFVGFPSYLLMKTSESVDWYSDATAGVDTTQCFQIMLKNIARVYAATNPTQAALAMWLFTEMWYAAGTVPLAAESSTTDRWALFANLIGYTTVAAQSPAALGLPIATHFDPNGLVVIRDGWAFTGVHSMVTFEAPPYQWTAIDYGQQNPGGFTIHRRGPLVIEPGAGAHNPYQESTWGKNQLIFPKPLETRGAIVQWDKGGMRPPRNATPTGAQPLSTAAWVPGSAYDLGGLKAGTGRVDLTDDTAAHRYSYVFADLTRSYNGVSRADHENSAKIVTYDRSLVRIPPVTPGTDPGYTIIVDRPVLTGTDVEPRWQLFPAAHTTPGTRTLTISGQSSTGSITRNGIPGTSWLGAGGTILGTISYSGVHQLSAKAFWSPLLPALCRINERGGPNASNLPYRADSHEWEDPYGYQGGNYTQEVGGFTYSDSGAPYVPWEGSFKYELLAQTQALTQPFLNVIEDVEPATASRTALETLQTATLIGVRIGTAYACVFKATSGVLTAGTFVLSAVGTYDVFIGDTPASTVRTLTGGGNIGSITLIATGGTTLTTNAQGGLWVRIVVSGAGSGAANTLTLS